MVDAMLVTVHGFWSSPAAWDGLRVVWQSDDELKDMRIHGFGYPSPKKPRFPSSRTRIPDLDDIAQTLAAEFVTVLAKAPSIAFVTHSQGGLVLQRFLAWMVSEGRARELDRIRSVVMLACPNGGSQYLDSIRRALGYSRHPQAGELQVLNKRVADTQRTVLERIVHASGIDDHQCKIPLHVYAGASDAIVPAASAQAAFPGAGTLAGDHFTILDPATPGNRTADAVKHHLLADLAAPPPSTVQPAGPVPPERPAGHGQPAPAGHSQPAVRVSGGQGVQIGDRNVQYNVFSPTADAGNVPRRPRPAPAVKEAFDLGLIIPLREEFDCARQVFRFGPQLREQGSYLYPFTVPGSDLRGVAVVLHDMGAAVSGVTAADLLSRFDLPVLALMGIAGALDGDLRLGDVVVAKVVDPYFHRARARPDASGDGFEFDSGGTAWRAGRDLVRFADNFRYRAGDPDEFAGWQARGEDRRKAAGLPGDGMPGRARPDYLVAPVASGEIVSAAAGFSRWLRTHHQECAAIEMEAGGVAQAVYEHGGTDMVIVRGISDFADERKTELDAAGGPAAAGHGAWREYAALNAADLLATLLRSPGFPWPSQSRLNR